MTTHWTDAHITCAWDDSDDKMYFTGYDECGEPLCTYSDRSIVVAYLEAYAKSLERYSSVSQRTATPINAGDVLCTEFGDFLVVATNFTSPQQLGLVNLVDHQLLHQTVTGETITIDDFAPFLHEQDVYQVRRRNTSVPEPTTGTRKYNVSDSGPFRDWNITLGTLQAINADNFDLAVEAAQRANAGMSIAHVEDFVYYLMEG